MSTPSSTELACTVVAIITSPVPSKLTAPLTSPDNVIVLAVSNLSALSAKPVKSPVTSPVTAPCILATFSSLFIFQRSSVSLYVNVAAAPLTVRPAPFAALAVPAPLANTMLISSIVTVVVFSCVVVPWTVKSPAITTLPLPSTVKFPDPTSSEFGAKLPVNVRSLSVAFLLLSIAAVKLGPTNNEPDPVLILISPLAVISVPAIVVNAPVLVVAIPTAPSKLVLAVITVPSIVVAPIVVLSGTLAPIVVPSIAPPLISTVPNVAVPPFAVIVVPTVIPASVSIVVNSPVALVVAPIVPVTAPVNAPAKFVDAVITVPSIVVPAIVVLEAELLPITTPSILPVLIVTPLKATVPEVAVKFPLNIVLPFAVMLSNVPCDGVIEPITPSIVLAVTDLVVDPIIATPNESNTSPVKLPPNPVVAVTDVPSSVVNLPVVAPPTALPIAV